MLVKFKCLRSGNVVSFTNENDIDSTRKHHGYEEVKENGLQEEKQIETSETQVKRRGRKKKGS